MASACWYKSCPETNDFSEMQHRPKYFETTLLRYNQHTMGCVFFKYTVHLSAYTPMSRSPQPRWWTYLLQVSSWPLWSTLLLLRPRAALPRQPQLFSVTADQFTFSRVFSEGNNRAWTTLFFFWLPSLSICESSNLLCVSSLFIFIV